MPFWKYDRYYRKQRRILSVVSLYFVAGTAPQANHALAIFSPPFLQRKKPSIRILIILIPCPIHQASPFLSVSAIEPL